MKHHPLQHTLEQRLTTLVAQRTITGDTTICFDSIHRIAKELKSYGMYVTTDASNAYPWLIATTRPTKRPRVLLTAHIDVVPPTSEDQFIMNIQGDRLIGRGVFDMKFAIACYLELAKQLAATESLHTYDFGILITSDEEAGGYNGAVPVFKAGWNADIVLLPDAVGKGWHIEAKAKAINTIQLTSKGKSAHGSRPWEADNPLTDHILPALQEITTRYPNHNKLDTTAAVTRIQGTGGTFSRSPDDALAIIDFRSFSNQDIVTARSFVEAIGTKYDLEVVSLTNEPCVILDKKHPLVVAFHESYKTVLRQPVVYTNSYGGSDARHMVPYGTTIILLTPPGAGLHSSNEWMRRDGLPLFYDLTHDYILRVAAIAQPVTPNVVAAGSKSY